MINKTNCPILGVYNAILDGCRKYIDDVQIYAKANNCIESSDDSAIQTLAISIETRPTSKPIYDYDDVKDSPEMRCQELAFDHAKYYLCTHIRGMLPNNTISKLETTVDRGNFALINGYHYNLLYSATLVLTDKVLYITYVETGLS